MANNTKKPCSSAHPEVPCSKCDESTKSTSATKCQPFLSSTIDRYAGRQENLGEQHRRLQNKIANMEKMIPALIAFGMCQQSCDDDAVESDGDALNRVRKMMRKISPMPDPADELVAELESCVEQLNQETAELHDKIISADIQLEEDCMELQSLELANRELEEQIRCLESQVGPQASLLSISSEDRICLTRIRALAEDHIKMKSNIHRLEEREKVLSCQLQKLFGGGKEPNCKKQLCNAARGSKHHVHRSKNQKKKDCNFMEKLKEPKTGCNTVKRLSHSKIPTKCPSQKEKAESDDKCVKDHEKDCEDIIKKDSQVQKKSTQFEYNKMGVANIYNIMVTSNKLREKKTSPPSSQQHTSDATLCEESDAIEEQDDDTCSEHCVGSCDGCP